MQIIYYFCFVEIIDCLIQLEEKKLNLLKELKNSLKYESCEYHLIKLKSCKNTNTQYLLFHKKSNLLLKSFRDVESFERFLTKRKIPNSNIYGMDWNGTLTHNIYVSDE